MNYGDLILSAFQTLLPLYDDYRSDYPTDFNTTFRISRLIELLAKVPESFGEDDSLYPEDALYLLYWTGHLYLDLEKYEDASIWLLKAYKMYRDGDFLDDESEILYSYILSDLEQANLHMIKDIMSK